MDKDWSQSITCPCPGTLAITTGGVDWARGIECGRASGELENPVFKSLFKWHGVPARDEGVERLYYLSGR